MDITTHMLRDIMNGRAFGLPSRSDAASDNLPRPVEIGEPLCVHGVLGEQIVLTRCDTSAVLEIDDGLVCTDAHLCLDRLRKLRDVIDRVIDEIERRAMPTVRKIVPGAPAQGGLE